MIGKELAQVLNKFLKSPNAQNARVQIETHRINIKGQALAGTWKMGKIIGKL